nr:MAG TPA: hypothetical protein [Caudoviricetes sp.]
MFITSNSDERIKCRIYGIGHGFGGLRQLRPLDVCRKPLLLRHIPQCLPVCTHGLPRGGVDGGVQGLRPICVCQQLVPLRPDRCRLLLSGVRIGMCGVPSVQQLLIDDVAGHDIILKARRDKSLRGVEFRQIQLFRHPGVAAGRRGPGWIILDSVASTGR